jgi:hypothetical protein
MTTTINHGSRWMSRLHLQCGVPLRYSPSSLLTSSLTTPSWSVSTPVVTMSSTSGSSISSSNDGNGRVALVNLHRKMRSLMRHLNLDIDTPQTPSSSTATPIDVKQMEVLLRGIFHDLMSLPSTDKHAAITKWSLTLSQSKERLMLFFKVIQPVLHENWMLKSMLDLRAIAVCYHYLSHLCLCVGITKRACL